MEIKWNEIKSEDITVDELRTYKGLENLTDAEAENAVKTIKELSLLICKAVERMYKNRPTKYIDNQCNMTIFASNKAA